MVGYNTRKKNTNQKEGRKDKPMGTCIMCRQKQAGTKRSRVFCWKCEAEVDAAVKRNREFLKQLNYDRRLVSQR